MVACSAPNCENRTEKGFRMFHFPTDDARRKKWIINCRRVAWTPSKNSRICEAHFEDSQYENKRADGWRKLKPNAIPTIFAVPNPPALLASTRRILKRCVDECNDSKTVAVDTLMEHSYCKPANLQRKGADTGVCLSKEMAAVETVPSTYISQSDDISCRANTIIEDDIPIASESEVATSSISIMEHFSLKERIRVLEAENQKLKNEVRRLRRKHKTSNSQLTVRDRKLKKIFNRDQLKALTMSSTRGTKWMKETVQKSLQLLFACGPSGYQALRDHGHPLPARRTLLNRIAGVRFTGGVLNEVFDLLRNKVPHMKSDKEKLCVLTLDEMSITPSTEYDTRTGRLMGDVTLPGHNGKATHALVFMLAGVSTRWKQTVAYYFTGNSVFGTVFKQIIINIVKKAAEIGLVVVSVTSDMGSCNQAMWRSFGISSGRYCDTVNKIEHPIIAGKHLYFIADPPHLIKNLKAALVNGQDIVLPAFIVQENGLTSSKVSVSHLRQLHEFQESRQLKLSPHLTEKTFTPGHFDKMKVSNATSFFSHSNSAGLEYLVAAHNYDRELLTTAWFLKTVNKWFDLVTSRSQVMALSMKNPEAYYRSVNFLKLCISLFRHMSIGSKGAWKPVQSGTILTTHTILDVAEDLLSDGFGFVLTSRFTSDCIENLFSCIRTNNPIPTPLEFKNKLRLVSIAQFLRLKSKTNYMEDDGNYLIDFLDQKKDVTNLEPDDDLPESLFFQEVVSVSDTELSSLYYLAGYVVSRVLKYSKLCDLCSLAIKAENPTAAGHNAMLLQLKSYRDGCLVSCSDLTFTLIKEAEKVFRSISFSVLHFSTNVRKLLLTEMQSCCCSIVFPQCHDVKNTLLKRYVTLRLRIWAKEQQKKEKCVQQHSSNGELGSKSMAMRMAVKKFK